MEYLFYAFPWFGCIILAMLLAKEKKLRRSENEYAQNEINRIKKNTKEEAKTMVAQLEARTQKELNDMRMQAEIRIREERETILVNKETMQALNEKELLIENLSALATYAQRLDRLENHLSRVAMSVDKVINEPVEEEKAYTQTGIITDDDLFQIVQKAAQGINRIKEITVKAAVVRGTVLSLNKLSTWTFRINFNDQGRLTGHYTIISENDDSTVPKRLAEEISKEIIYRLNSKRK